MFTSTDTVPDCKVVVFQWSTHNGTCYDCGLPAAFQLGGYGPKWTADELKRCAVCAANAACDGEIISRIDEEEDW